MRPVSIAATLIIVILLSFQNCSNKLMTPDTPVIDYSSVQSISPDCFFNRSGLMNGDSVQAYQSSTVPIGQQCKGQVRTCQNGALTGTYEYSFCLPGAPAACLIDGRTIPSGGSIKTYSSATVGYGRNCEEISQVRTCTNGVLTGSFTFGSCVTERPKDCTLNGTIIANGQSKRYYREAVVPFLGNCAAELRVCTDGTLSGSFVQTSCTPATAVGCTVNGVSMTHGQTMSFFNVNTVAYDKICPASAPRTCNNGAVTGDASYIYNRCDPVNANDCSFNGAPVKHNESIDAFRVSTVPFGQSCLAQKESRRCTNGTLAGSFQFSSCVEGQPTGTCPIADGGALAHGQIGSLYRVNFVTHPGTCDTSGGGRENVYCDNGTPKVGSASGAVISGPRYNACVSGGRENTDWHGGRSLALFDPVACPGNRITGLFFGYDNENPDIDSMGVFCGGNTVSPSTVVGASRSNPHHSTCTGNKSVVGVYGQDQDGYLNYTITVCANEDGTGREPTAEAGFNNFGAEISHTKTWYQMCKPGYVVNKLAINAAGNANVNGFNMECLQVAAPANINCQGVWLSQGCPPNGNYPNDTEMFYYSQPAGGTGAACPVQQGTTRRSDRLCDPCIYGGCGGGGGGGPGDGGGGSGGD